MKRRVKANTIKRIHRINVIAVVSLVVAVALCTGVYFGYDQLRNLWLEQFRVTDMPTQVSVTSGKMVKNDVIESLFGIKRGANLATIDYEAKRQETLKRIPNLRNLEIVRTLPGKLTIVAEERVPIARIRKRGERNDRGFVADCDGVVFRCSCGTKFLPMIRENVTPGIAAGNALSGRMRAALMLIEACRDPKYQDIGILEVDLTHTDYLLAVLGDSYSQLKIAWRDMDENTPSARASLIRQLDNFKTARSNNLTGDSPMIWNATDYTSDHGVIYANRKGSL